MSTTVQPRAAHAATPVTRGPRPQPLGTVRATLLVAEREVLVQLRSKSFLISTAILLAAVLAGIVVSAVMSQNADPDRVAVVAGTSSALPAGDAYEAVEADDEVAARELVESGDVVAAVVPDDGSATGVRILALDDEPTELVAALAEAPEVELLDPSDTDATLRYVVSFGFGLVFLMSATAFGSTIAQNTVQEKQSRIVEMLLATVPARALLAGKILGNSALAFAQTAAIAAVSVVGLVATGQDEVLRGLGSPLVWFVIFFLVGFVLLAAVFAASASLVSRQEDVGSVLTPAMMLTMIPYFAVIFFNDNDAVLRVMSYVPFSAPVGMPVRLFLGDAAWWEPLLSLVVLALSTVVVIAIGARIYERSLLRTGPRVRLREVLTQD